jgi:hypothetical protein
MESITAIAFVKPKSRAKASAHTLNPAQAKVTATDATLTELYQFHFKLHRIEHVISTPFSMTRALKIGLCCKNFLKTEQSLQSAHAHAATPKI